MESSISENANKNYKATNPTLKVGDTIEIISMKGDHNEPRYNGRKGTIYMIDKYGMCHGDWEGTFPVDPKRDEYKIINSKEQTNECKI